MTDIGEITYKPAVDIDQDISLTMNSIYSGHLQNGVTIGKIHGPLLRCPLFGPVAVRFLNQEYLVFVDFQRDDIGVKYIEHPAAVETSTPDPFCDLIVENELFADLISLDGHIEFVARSVEIEESLYFLRPLDDFVELLVPIILRSEERRVGEDCMQMTDAA